MQLSNLTTDYEYYALGDLQNGGKEEDNSESTCLKEMWLAVQQTDINGSYCHAVWDGFYCWSFTPAGETITRGCSSVFQESYPFYSEHLEGNAVRVCLENGTWLDGVRTDYTECARSLINFEGPDASTSSSRIMVEITKYTVFIGSILSFALLGLALGVFCSFRRVWNQRLKIHVNLMLALLIRFVVLIIVTEPFTSRQNGSYRDYGTSCKIILIAHLHSTITFVSWVLIQGIYLNVKLTNVFAQFSTQNFRLYYIFGWGLPALLVMIYPVAMIINHPLEDCWHGYSEMKEMQILLIPTILALLVNGLLLCNILRIIVKRKRSLNTETSRTISVAKATLMLSPILGLNNLVFIYNPGGEYEKVYVALNTFFGSTQGVFVAIVYWCNCTELHEAIQRSFMRFMARRNFRSSLKSDEVNDEVELSTIGKSSPQQICNKKADENV